MTAFDSIGSNDSLAEAPRSPTNRINKRKSVTATENLDKSEAFEDTFNETTDKADTQAGSG